MTTFLMIEALLDQVKDMLMAELPERLLAITTEKGDDLDLPMFADHNVYIVEKQVLPEFPSLEIVGGRSTFSRRVSIDLIYDSSNTITCIVTVAGSNEETIMRQIARYLRAIAELMEDNAAHDRTYDTVLVETNFTGVVAQESVFLKSGWATFTLETREG